LVKNLEVYSKEKSIDKRAIHSLISFLKSHFRLNISFLSISFISTSELKTINKKYLKHDYNTDVITFNYSKRKNEIDGEILISYEEARINSKRYKTIFKNEIKRLVIHGVLHLLNYNDNNTENRTIMKKTENKLINRYNFTLLAGK
jgi:probable rRNA maturation factor